jgi:hypothetical protein
MFSYLFRKEQLQKQREYLKQKKQKKLVKMKELEEAREEEKSKWQTFNAKVCWHSFDSSKFNVFFFFLHLPFVLSFLLSGSENQERWNSQKVHLCHPRWTWR